MSGEVIEFRPDSLCAGARSCLARIDGVLAIFRAIDAGELLAALPDCEMARADHAMALSLLALAEREVLSLKDQFAT